MKFSLVGKTAPPFAFSNEVNGGGIDASNDRQRVGRYAGAKSFSDVNYLSLRKFVAWCIFATKVNKASFPLVPSVFGQRDPLKIFRPVIKFVTVDMVYGKTLLKARNKGNRDKSVD